MTLEQTEGFATIIGVIITGVLNWWTARQAGKTAERAVVAAEETKQKLVVVAATHDEKIDKIQKAVDGPLGDSMRTSAILARRLAESTKNELDAKEAERLEAVSMDHNGKMADPH